MLGQNVASMDIDKSASKKVDIMVLKTLDTFVYCQAYSALSGLSPNSRPKASYKFPKNFKPKSQSQDGKDLG